MATQEKTGYRMVVYWYLCGTYGSNYRKLVKVVRHAKKAIVGTNEDWRELPDIHVLSFNCIVFWNIHLVSFSLFSSSGKKGWEWEKRA